MGLDVTTIKPRRPEPPRDQWDRYLATDAEGNPKTFRRATSVSGKVGSTFGLERWQQGQVASGMGQRPTLVKLAQAHPDWYTNKKLYQEICEAAHEASGANEGRRLGTALHGLTQELDEGRLTPERMQDIAEIDPDDLLRLDRYQQAITDAGIKIDTRHIEQILLLDQPAIAGTADRLCWLPDGRYCIMDLKTGKLDYGEMEWAAQLAMYANHDATWNHVKDEQWERGPKIEGIDLQTAIIVHLPAQGDIDCTIWELDLELGYSALIYASYVLDYGNMKALSPYGTSATLAPKPTLVGPPASPENYRAWLAGRIETVVSCQVVLDMLDAGPTQAVDYLMGHWPSTVPRPLPAELAQYQVIDLDRVLTIVETKWQLPFPGAMPGTTVTDIRAARSAKSDDPEPAATVKQPQVPVRAPQPPPAKKAATRRPAAKKAAAKKAATPAKKTNTTKKES